MRKGETLEQESERKEQEIARPGKLLSMIATVEQIHDRLVKMLRVSVRINTELQDNKSMRLKECACGRQWTRFEKCVICLGEEKK